MSAQKGRVAVVTGASRGIGFGIGFGIARRFVEEGAKVYVTARQPDALADTLADAAGALGGPVNAVAGRADDPEHRAATARHVTDLFGPPDILVSNTGINPVYGPLLDLGLAAAEASWITGQTLIVDGGVTLARRAG